MSKLDVSIVKVEPLRAISIWGFGPNPEDQAWAKLEAWAKPKGLLNDPEAHPIYGFNNPNPSPGSPNYGYELWMVVGDDVEPEGDLRVIDFEGGLYAVTRCEVLKEDFEVIGATWRELVAWREDSEYKAACHQWLEKSVLLDLWGSEIPPELAWAMDLYLPIAK